MRAMLLIAQSTFREVTRDRILYLIFMFGLLLIAISVALAQLTFAEQGRLTTNFALTGIHMSSVVIAIFCGSSLVFREIERQTILTILVRPISRFQFLTGKILGLSAVILLVTLGLALVGTGIIHTAGGSISAPIVLAVISNLIEALLLVCVATFFGTFCRPVLTVMFATSFYLIGHWVPSLMFFATQSKSEIFKGIAYVTARILPDLERLNFRNQIFNVDHFDYQLYFHSLLYGFIWIILVVALSQIIFKRRDFV